MSLAELASHSRDGTYQQRSTLPTFLSYYGGDSPPFGLPIALRRGFGQCVGDWLQGILSIFFRDFPPLLGYRPVQVFSSCGNVPLGEFILVELDLGFCTSDFLNHPAKRNVGQSRFCLARRISDANICVPSVYHNWEPKFTKTYRGDSQRTIPLSLLAGRQVVFLRSMYCLW